MLLWLKEEAISDKVDIAVVTKISEIIIGLQN